MENAKIVMATLNGLPRSWDSFIQGICARKKLVKFNRLWEECSQEESRIAAQEEKMGSEDQALMVHFKSTKRRYHHPRGKHYHKDNTRNICLGSYVIHMTKQDTMQEIVLRNKIRKRATKEDIMLMLQRMMNHPRKELDMKVNILQARMNMF